MNVYIKHNKPDTIYLSTQSKLICLQYGIDHAIQLTSQALKSKIILTSQYLK